ncbi:hypothetical protein LguiB_015540 [Lonicera macranthoides]
MHPPLNCLCKSPLNNVHPQDRPPLVNAQISRYTLFYLTRGTCTTTLTAAPWVYVGYNDSTLDFSDSTPEPHRRQINIIHGYSKVNPIEEEENHTNKPIQTQNPRFTIAISLILLLLIIIGSLIGTLIHESTTEPPDSPSESIQSICSVTQHPDSCFTSISSLKTNPQNDPQLIFSLLYQLGANELANLSRSHYSPTAGAAGIGGCGNEVEHGEGD